MKKHFLFVALIALVATASFAQLGFGIKAGANFSNITGSNNSGTTTGSTTTSNTTGHNFRPGFLVGVFVEYSFTDVISLQPELLYSVKGFRDKASSSVTVGSGSSSTNDNILYSFSYVDLPILLNLKFGTGSFICLGPQISFLTGNKWSGTQTSTVGSISTTTTESGSSTSGMNKTDFGLAVGTGYKAESGIEFALRFVYGLSNINSNTTSSTSSSTTTPSTDVSHNIVISASLGYEFGGGGHGGHHRRR